MAKLITALVLMVSVVMAHNPSCTGCDKHKPMMDGEHMNCDEKNPRQMMETVRIWKMTEALDLTEDQTIKLFPKMKEMRDMREQFQKSRSRIIEDLEGYLRDSKKFGNELKAKLQELDLSEGEMHDQQQKLKKEIANILTPEQQVKFMLFQMRFDKEMREMIGKAKGMCKDVNKMRQDMRKERKEERQSQRKRWRLW